jgi:hypothetical protein
MHFTVHIYVESPVLRYGSTYTNPTVHTHIHTQIHDHNVLQCTCGRSCCYLLVLSISISHMHAPKNTALYVVLYSKAAYNIEYILGANKLHKNTICTLYVAVFVFSVSGQSIIKKLYQP